MPELNDVEITPNYLKRRWIPCKDCGKMRWVQFVNGKPTKIRCRSCARRLQLHPKREASKGSWKGGRIKRNGYIYVLLKPTDQFYPMVSEDGYIAEHRLIVVKRLNRCLASTESVHHINGIKDDNRYENLELISPSNHVMRSQFCTDCELRKEIRLQRWRIKCLEEQVRKLTSITMGIPNL